MHTLLEAVDRCPTVCGEGGKRFLFALKNINHKTELCVIPQGPPVGAILPISWTGALYHGPSREDTSFHSVCILGEKLVVATGFDCDIGNHLVSLWRQDQP
jgi:hypothetical protein